MYLTKYLHYFLVSVIYIYIYTRQQYKCNKFGLGMQTTLTSDLHVIYITMNTYTHNNGLNVVPLGQSLYPNN